MTNDSHAVIYCLTSPDGRSYIGCTTDLHSRTLRHRNRAHSRLIREAVERYGFENFTIRVLEEGKLCDMRKRERDWITERGSIFPNGFNQLPGGEGHFFQTQSSRQKISKANSERIITDELRANSSKSQLHRFDEAIPRLMCKYGHMLTPENTYTEVKKSGRPQFHCKVCRKAAYAKIAKARRLAIKTARRTLSQTRTHCSAGHELTPDNTYEVMRDGAMLRGCRMCKSLAAKKGKENREKASVM